MTLSIACKDVGMKNCDFKGSIHGSGTPKKSGSTR